MAQQQQMMQISTEQLQQIIDAVRLSAGTATVDENGTPLFKTKGSFSECKSRFGGQRDHDAVEEFINSITTYKDVESISDDDALKGISLLFFGLASTWWQGVRKEAKTWPDVITLIRDHFSPSKPPHQVYMEIMEKKQDSQTPIDLFICQKRALLAQLPDGRHDEETELDLVYGMLNIKYRKYIARQEVKTFRELLEKGRIIESNTTEMEELPTGPLRGAKGIKRCTYCNFRGHTFDQCRKRKQTDNASNAGD